MGTSEFASPVRYTALRVVVPLLGPIWAMPSTSKRSFPVRRPLVLALPAPAPGFVMTPGRNCSRRSKFRPFRGKALMAALLTVPPKVESVVSISGISPVTVTVWVCSPG